MKIGILEQGGFRAKPTLLDGTGSYSTTGAASRTQQITPPVGTNLLVVCSGILSSASRSLNVPTFNGVAMDVGVAYSETSNGAGVAQVGIHYMFNPPTGSLLDILLSTVSGSWTDSIISAFCWKDARSVGAGNSNSSSGASSSVTNTITLADLAVACSVLGELADNNTPGAASWNVSNLVIEDGGSSTKIALATAYREAALAIGSTNFTWAQTNNNWVGSNGNIHRMLAKTLDIYG